MSVVLCPSMMCADFSNLKREIDLLEEAGADIFHLDIMDGHYVQNFGMGLQDVKYICQYSRIRTEVHLMIEEPVRYIELFVNMGVNIVYIHPEAEYHAITTLQKMQEFGIETGIVISPGVAISSVKELLNLANRVMIMGVNPGHAGQIYMPYVETKIEELLEMKKKYRFKFSIGMDGACNLDRINRLSKKGVENFVLGTAALFYGDMDYKKRFMELKSVL